jgi:hypothetical protein
VLFPITTEFFEKDWALFPNELVAPKTCCGELNLVLGAVGVSLVLLAEDTEFAGVAGVATELTGFESVSSADFLLRTGLLAPELVLTFEGVEDSKVELLAEDASCVVSSLSFLASGCCSPAGRLCRLSPMLSLWLLELEMKE